MDATRLLKDQHLEVKRLFQECENLDESQFKRRSEIVEQITQKLRFHTQIEEEILYPAASNVDHEMILESFEEHHMVKILLEEIEQTQPSNERYVAKLTVLKDLLEHHIEEEEETLFPELMQECGADRLYELGQQLQERFNELQRGVTTSR